MVKIDLGVKMIIQKICFKKIFKTLKKNNQFDLNNKKLSFKNDKTIQNQLLITVAPDGFKKIMIKTISCSSYTK